MADARSGYLSRLLQERVASTPRLSAPEARHVPAVLLLSDIERFTALVETLSATGREGLEELTWVLNAYFADLVEVVHAHGGDVLYIAGDAFLCHWPVEDEPPGVVVVRAAQCGLVIQQRLHDRVVRPGLTIRTRIGVGAGELVTAFVGGVSERWELVATGPALGDAIGAEARAPAGGVVLSPHAADAAGGQVTGTRDARGFLVLRETTRITPPPIAAAPTVLDETLLEPLLPPAVVDRLAVPGAQWLAEVRRVTVLLAQLPPLTDARTALVDQTHAAVRAFQQVIVHYGGTIKVDVDAKGILLLAIFGLPPRAHEDDAERAILAATRLAESLESVGASSGIGITTGRAICGAFGSDARRDYMVRGDVINLAARLMQTASAGEILCDGDTVVATRGRMEFEERGRITVKGRSKPVPLHRPAGRRAATSRSDVEIVGRVAEREAIRLRLQALGGTKESSVVLIEGEAGMGKSRLLTDATARVHDAGITVLHAAADAIEQATPYFAWRPVFMAYFGITAALDAATARERVETRLRGLEGLERLVPLLGGVLPLSFADNELTADMGGEVRAANTKRLLLAVLRDVAAAGPVMLAVEDAHWLDSSSWDLLLETTSSVTPIMVLVTTRPMPEPAPPEYGRLVRAAGDHRLVLAGLSPEEMVGLIARRLGVRDVPDALASFIRERVSGHPFFAEELLQAIVERGAVRVEAGTCTVGDLTSLDLPTTVEQVIVSRLDRLTPAERMCLKVASVIGRVFRSRLVEQTYPVADERGRVPGHLESLTTANLINLETPEPELAYLFKHVITRDVTYETMPLAQRRPLHRAVAEWYEAHHDDLTPYYTLLAYHWGQAAEPLKTVAYLEKAGHKAVREGAFREGVVFLSQAIALMEEGAVPADMVRLARCHKGTGIAKYFLSDMQQSRAHLARALAGLDKPVPNDMSGAVRGVLRAVLRQVAHSAAPARFHGRRAVEKAVLDDAVECYRFLGNAFYMEGEGPAWLLYSTVNGLNLGEQAGPSASLARVLINSAMLAYIVGLPRRAERYERRAMAMAEQIGDLSAQADVWSIRALLYAQQARWRDVREANDRALALARELGDAGLESHVWLVRSTVSHCAGDFTYAPTAWQSMREVATRNGNDSLYCWSLLDEVETRLARGELAEAEQALAKALAIPTPASDLTLALEKQRGVAGVRLRQGRIDEALAAADATFDLTVKTPPTGYHAADHFAAAVDVYLSVLREANGLDADRRRELQRRATKGVAMLARFSRTYANVRARSWTLRGVLDAERGRAARARRSLERAATVAQQLEMPFEHARALLELARLDRDGDRSREEARRLFEATGAPYYASLA